MRSREGRGSRFSISLPLSDVRPELTTQDPLHEGASASMLAVLVVDDDLQNREAMESYLAVMGHSIVLANSARGALALVDDFDVALIDFNLGNQEDGLWLIARLRERCPNARFALVTAARPDEYATRAELAQVSVLRKPVSVSDLENWLHADVKTSMSSPI